MHDDTGVVVVSGEILTRFALSGLLESEPGFRVSGLPHGKAIDLVRFCRERKTSVVVLDVGDELGSAVSLISELSRNWSGISVVAVVQPGSTEAPAKMFGAGSNCVIARDATPEEFVVAVHEAAAGHVYASRTVMRIVRDLIHHNDGARGALLVEQHGLLSEREQAVVAQLVQGKTNLEIARAMHVSEATVKAHLSRVMAKWNARDRVQVVILALAVKAVNADALIFN